MSCPDAEITGSGTRGVWLVGEDCRPLGLADGVADGARSRPGLGGGDDGGCHSGQGDQADRLVVAGKHQLGGPGEADLFDVGVGDLGGERHPGAKVPLGRSIRGVLSSRTS